MSKSFCLCETVPRTVSHKQKRLRHCLVKPNRLELVFVLFSFFLHFSDRVFFHILLCAGQGKPRSTSEPPQPSINRGISLPVITNGPYPNYVGQGTWNEEQGK